MSNMRSFDVYVPEVFVRRVMVIADSSEEAIDLVESGKGEELSTEYSHSLGTEEWKTIEYHGETQK